MSVLRRWLAGGALLLSACGGGLCEGTGGIVDECFEGWTREECEDWDEEGVNGASWTWHASGTCEDRGYGYDCDGAWLRSSSDCASASWSTTY